MKAQSSATLMRPGAVRGVTAGERTLLAEVFGKALNADRLRLWSCQPVGWWIGRAFCAGGMLGPWRTMVVYPPKAALADFTAPGTPLSATGTFVHECTHAAQSQAGVSLLLGKLRAGDSLASYRYSLSPDTRWAKLNIEQQAMAVEHAFLASRGKTAPFPPEAYAAICPYPIGCATKV